MPLTGTEHFPLDEILNASGGFIPPALEDNAQATVEELELVRHVLGDGRLALTSLYRSPAHNAALPGSSSSSPHLTATGADFVPLDISLEDAARRWVVAVDQGQVPAFHQFILEDAGEDGTGAHIHYGRGSGDQLLYRTAQGVYQQLRQVMASILASPGGAAAGGAVLGLLAFFFRALVGATCGGAA